MNKEQLPEFLKPRLRLFLSADIVGSTALKQSPRDGKFVSNEWFAIIQGFYVEVQRRFLEAWDTHAKNSPQRELVGEPPEVWKVIGDEIVFTKILSDHRQMYVAISCWTHAIQEVRRWVRSRSNRLDVKCTVWTAGFPILNKEVVVRNGDDDPFQGSGDYFIESGTLLNERYRTGDRTKVTTDYIGPSIDIGFRLTGHATPRKLIISVGVAYTLSRSDPPDDIPELNIQYDGSFQLKGVFGGAPYPIFWIDMAAEGDLALLEDQLIIRDHCERDAVRRYCTKFFDENRSYTFPPFIDSGTEITLNRKPDWYDETIRTLARNFDDVGLADLDAEKIAEQEKPQEEKPPPADSQIAALLTTLPNRRVAPTQRPQIVRRKKAKRRRK